MKGERLSGTALTAIIIALVIVLNVIVFVLDAHFGLYLYKPKTADMSISGATDSYFREAMERGERVKVMFCRAEDEVKSNSKGQYVLDTARQLAERYPDFIELDFLNIIRKVNSKGELVDLTKYQTKGEDGKLTPLLKSSVIFECGNNVKVLTDGYSSTGYSDFYTVDSSGNAYAYNGEEIIASMIMWVLKDEHKTAYFTTYHGEGADYGLRNMLISAGYNVDNSLDIKNNEIPSDAGLIIISNPVKDFERGMAGTNVESEIERLRSYVKNGGRLYIALDPYAPSLPVLEEFIDEFGIAISTTDRDGESIRNIVRDSENAITADFYTLVARYADTHVGNMIGRRVKAYSSADVIVRESAVLSLDGELGAEPILLTSEVSELYAAGAKVNSDGSYCVSAVSKFVNEDGVEGSITVTPNVYMTATDALVSGGYANREFLYAMMETVFGAEDLPYGCNTVFFTEDVLENLTMGTARLYTVLIFLIPAAIMAVGVFVVIRRKNR